MAQPPGQNCRLISAPNLVDSRGALISGLLYSPSSAANNKMQYNQSFVVSLQWRPSERKCQPVATLRAVCWVASLFKPNALGNNEYFSRSRLGSWRNRTHELQEEFWCEWKPGSKG